MENEKWKIKNGNWRMRENIIRDKSFAFALRVVKLARHLQSEKKEFVLWDSGMRSGTAIGAWYGKQSMQKAKQTLFTR